MLYNIDIGGDIMNINDLTSWERWIYMRVLNAYVYNHEVEFIQTDDDNYTVIVHNQDGGCDEWTNTRKCLVDELKMMA